MPSNVQTPAKTMSDSLRASIIMLFFGLTVLTFLVAIERPHWFHIRPGSGTAVAISAASDTDAGVANRR